MLARSHTVLLAFAVVFAMGMALAVAILCIPAIEPDPPPADTSALSEPPQSTLESESEAPAVLPDVSNGLQFTSFGDGTCALTGIGVCIDACVVIPEFSPLGDRVVEIAPRALYGVSTVTAIGIPASVRVIGELAFAACENLIYISVSAQNIAFCDAEGVLYTFDRAVLLAYPAARAGDVATISAQTTRISDMAFFGCVYLKSICYQGSAADWEKIAIGSKNYSLIAASKTFLGEEE